MKTLSETQRFSPYTLIVILAIIFITGFINFHKGQMNTEAYAFFGCSILFVVALYSFVILKTTFDSNQAIASFGIFKITIQWCDVSTIELKTYNPLFTGYGIRYSFFPMRKIYNTQGNIGLYLNGKKNYMIGVKSVDAMQLFLKELAVEYPRIEIKSNFPGS